MQLYTVSSTCAYVLACVDERTFGSEQEQEQGSRTGPGGSLRSCGPICGTSVCNMTSKRSKWNDLFLYSCTQPYVHTHAHTHTHTHTHILHIIYYTSYLPCVENVLSCNLTVCVCVCVCGRAYLSKGTPPLYLFLLLPG